MRGRFHKAITTAAFLLFTSDPSGAGEIASYKITYSMTIAKPVTLLPLMQRGEVIASQVETCNAWQSVEFVKLEFGHSNPDRGPIVSNAQTTEAKSGEKFAFRSTTSRGNDAIEVIAGTARMLNSAASGRADFDSPERKTISLSPKTLFPMHALQKALDQIRAGKKIIRQVEFTGTDVKGSKRTISRVMGVSKHLRLVDFDESLRLLPAWRMESHRFDGTGVMAAEVGHAQGILYGNGVYDIERISKGSTEYSLTPVEFKLLPRPNCSGSK